MNGVVASPRLGNAAAIFNRRLSAGLDALSQVVASGGGDGAGWLICARDFIQKVNVPLARPRIHVVRCIHVVQCHD